MKILYANMASGFSGRMFLSSLFQLGVSVDKCCNIISSIFSGSVNFNIEYLNKNNINCGKLDIDYSNINIDCSNFNKIIDTISSSNINEKVKENSIKILSYLAESISLVENQPIENIDFSKICNIESVIISICVSFAIEELSIKKVIVSDILIGEGFNKNSSLPTPETIKLLQNLPVKKVNVDGEVTTALCIAIIKTFVTNFEKSFSGKIIQDVYVASSNNFDNLPNYSSVMIIDDNKDIYKDEVLLMKTNIDDMSGENFGFLLNALLEMGALDVSYSPAYGKKNRPLYMLTVMLPKESEKDFAKIIFKYSTTAGIRVQSVERLIMGREMMNVYVEGEVVSVKKLYYDDIEKYCPEWDDCVRVSKKLITTPTDIHVKATMIAMKGDK